MSQDQVDALQQIETVTGMLRLSPTPNHAGVALADYLPPTMLDVLSASPLVNPCPSPGPNSSLSRHVQVKSGVEGECPVCGFPEGIPGKLRVLQPGGLSRLVDCPTCSGNRKIARLKDRSRLTGELLGHTFDNYQVIDGKSDAWHAALAFANQPHYWLTLWGNYGTGKTHLLAAIVNYCNANQIPAMYLCLPELLEDLREGYQSDNFNRLLRQFIEARVLVVDEADSRVDLSKPWARDKIVQIFEARVREWGRIGTAFGMNTHPERRDFVEGDILGWMFARMNDRRCKIIHVGGTDMRSMEQEVNDDGND